MKIKQTIYIDEELAKHLKIAAIKQDLKIGELVEKLIKENLKEK